MWISQKYGIGKEISILEAKIRTIIGWMFLGIEARNREGRAKYCSGYESFPRNFKKLIKVLNELFESDIDFQLKYL